MEKDVARQRAWRWMASVALFLPVIVLYLCEYLRGDGRSFTGFIQYDQASYMADARAYFQGGFHLFYGNPYSPGPGTPRIYFQIQFLLLGFVQKVTGWDSGLVYVLFGFVAGVICIRVAMALYEDVAGLRTGVDWIGLVLFIWGGGILELMGFVSGNLFAFDPAGGWWLLNLGRNLVYPTEAYYHALALGLILVARRGNFRMALTLGVALMLSHPFTGLQMLLVVTVWAGFESVVLKNRAVPFLFAATMAYLVFLHLLYYVVLLNMFEEHRVIFAQWSLAWTESALTAFGADLLVGLLALWAMRTWALAREVFSQAGARLLAVWFVVSVLLAHHDLLFPPKQPLHFTHGYSWCALFLLGVRPLRRLIETILSWRALVMRWAALSLFFTLAFSDNAIWLGFQGTHLEPALALDDSDRELLRWLNQRPEPHTELLVSKSTRLPLTFLAMTYTDYRGWASHYATTPYALERAREVDDFFNAAKASPGWSGKVILAILSKSEPAKQIKESTWGDPVFQNAEYEVYRIDYR
jgi:hypothetical protein